MALEISSLKAALASLAGFVSKIQQQPNSAKHARQQNSKSRSVAPESASPPFTETSSTPSITPKIVTSKEVTDRFSSHRTKEEFKSEFQARWEKGGTQFLAAYGDLLLKAEANEKAAEFVKEMIRDTVEDPTVAELLCPTNIIGCKRLCVDTDYYETFNRDNVTLVDLRKGGIENIQANGVKTGQGEYEFDVLVYATGFDAMTGALGKIDIRGRNNTALTEHWEAGPRTYLGLQASGFPNLFTITGPGSPSVLSNMIVSIEQHVDWISDCIAYMDKSELATIEPTLDAEDKWIAHVNEAAEGTMFTAASCNSWYLGANIPGKPRIFMPYVGGVGTYRETCDRVAANDYEGFVLSAS